LQIKKLKMHFNI